MTTKKRGRPFGSTNKPKWPDLDLRSVSLQEKLRDWDEQDLKAIDIQKLDLKAVIDEKSFEINSLNHQIIGYKAVISYLEHQLGLKKSQ